MPVLSIATCSTRCRLSQSLSASRSAVMAPKLCTSRCTVPSGSLSSTQATTVLWCTSSPQQRAYTTCMACPPSQRAQHAQRVKRGKGRGVTNEHVSSACSAPRVGRGDNDLLWAHPGQLGDGL